jgi:DNA-directed RNA polymerase specialized sigma24 family protein
MPPEKRDLDQVFAQPFPHFLEMMKTARAAGLAEFAKCARPWLSAHPTPSMRTLTAAEQQDVVEETVQRCLQKDGEPLQNYTDLWGNFGAWLASVAENTCAAKHKKPGQSAPQPQPTEPVREPAGVSAGAAAPGPAAPGKPSLQTVPKEERPSRAVHAFLQWLRSPLVFVPILILAAIAIVRGIRPDIELIPSRKERSIPVIAALLPESETKNVYYDVLETPMLPPAPDGVQTRRSVTTIFRQDRLVVLRLERDLSKESSPPSGISIWNKAGETIWSTALEPGFIEAEVLYLRLDSTTFPSDDYEVSIVDSADVAVAGSTFMIR